MRVRRSRFAAVRFADRAELDWAAAVLGLEAVMYETVILGLSPVAGRVHPLERSDLDLMARLPDAGWAELAALEEEGWERERITELVGVGLLVSDPAAQGEPLRLREREEALDRDGWEATAALHHFLGRWSGVDVRGPGGHDDLPGSLDGQHETLVRSMAREVERIARAHGPPPPAVAPLPPGDRIPLPAPAEEGPLFDVLRRRRTTRRFAPVPIPGERFSSLLHHVFGYLARQETGVGPLLRRSSPSGGSLHPVVAHPLVIDVEGIEPGLHHYDPDGHALVPIESMDREAAAALAQRAAAGQPWAGSAGALVLLTARWPRTFWKYRRHPKAYRVVAMDAGHLSQTFYLVCTALGLGSFVTAAINELDLEARLGLDGLEGGLVAALGCGVPASGQGEAGIGSIAAAPGRP